ncbi:MAG: hypothetical protein KGJ62_12160 [Armatimonadetes bacterium]|nr:hypothetical protein [Armatimonadota bacterium]MDE2206887.1 hypothetical protein [Armatimonadota bacterium]
MKGLSPFKLAAAAAICLLAISAALITNCSAPQPGRFHKRVKATGTRPGATAPNVSQPGSDNSY